MTDSNTNNAAKSAQPELSNTGANAGDGGVRIPVNQKLTEIAPEVEAMIKEYEMRYKGFREDEPMVIGDSAENATPAPSKPKNDAQYDPKRVRATLFDRQGMVTNEQERQWAALAHASSILTLLLAISTFGTVSMLAMFIPLMIFLHYREKSEFVAYHASQAFALQVLGTLGWVIGLVILTIVAVILTVVLAITIIGVLLIPFVWLAYTIIVLASLGLPLGMLVFGGIGAWESYKGIWYRIPFLGKAIERRRGMNPLSGRTV